MLTFLALLFDSVVGLIFRMLYIHSAGHLGGKDTSSEGRTVFILVFVM